MASRIGKGVFCLEGDWETDLRKPATVGPVLELLEKSHAPRVRHIRRDIGTPEEFEYYLRKWIQRRYAAYPILYLAFHGGPGEVFLSEQSSAPIGLDWLEDRLASKCRGRVILFGSCQTMDRHGNRLRRFLEKTGALAVCGYRVEVDWMRSAAFELLLLSAFQHNTFTRQGMEAVDRRIRREASALVRDLQFRMVIGPAAKKRKTKV